MEKMLAYLFKKYGSKCYVVAADYNYGILSAEWVKYLVPKLGGEVVGIEYLDEKMMDFTSVIDRILQVPVSYTHLHRLYYSGGAICLQVVWNGI